MRIVSASNTIIIKCIIIKKYEYRFYYTILSKFINNLDMFHKFMSNSYVIFNI